MLIIEIAGFLLFLSVFLLFEKKVGKVVTSYVIIGIIALLLVSLVFSGIDETSRFIFVFGIVTMIGLFRNLKREKKQLK
ncbi:hypothetical protein [Halobacillus halophilus]|uniref:hypothetical protein n=1 Tax=Halobacillus halophilus TaxID=1570 RepID=UPI001CD8132D|nr:hypothetical protein [Halobacillus halophilus]MCA1010756.1 hypothetical protein [Halobacillus halophilus]